MSAQTINNKTEMSSIQTRKLKPEITSPIATESINEKLMLD